MWSSKEKGKGRATPMAFNATISRRNLLARDSEGSGGPDGIVLPLQYISDGPNDISYTLPILVGSDDNPQNFSLQVDTGSSDLWIASNSCSSSVCGQAPRYDADADATPTGYDFTISYLVGNVSGPIVWDSVTIGGYNIDAQALAAADVVDGEPLESQFSGVLGLALPTDSIIAGLIQPGLGDAPDGAVWTSNLFGITPISSAPSARFFSIALERPGSAAVPSILGIGRHPAALVPDPSRITYSILYEPSSMGPRFWKTSVRGITVYTNSSRMPIQLGRGASGGAFPSAVLDTGVPLILTTKAVADAIYGAIGVNPAADNMYYLPCTTPLNMTVTLDGRDEIPIHPLDLWTPPGSGAPDPSSCIGLIQASADATLRNPTSDIGDMIFGVPFLRNVYTVLAYDVPFANGSFPAPIANDTTVRPRLGLLNLTDPTVAMDEFHRVRVLNQPLGQSDGGVTTNPSGSHKQNVGIDVLIALGAFVGLCLVLFGLRWLFVRRSLRRGADDNLSARDAKSHDLTFALGGYQLAQRSPRADDGLPTEDELRQRRYEAYKQSLHTVSTDRTQIEPVMDESGYITEAVAVTEPVQQEQPLLPVSPREHSPFLQEHSPERDRHSRVLSVNLPLMPAPDSGVGAEDAELNPAVGSMAGIGTARHSAAFARGRSDSHRVSGAAPSPSHSPDS
ncbi:aspartic peptidase domain-containing protein [Mycena capillaripes]|nr:aspartic peptidase domain-containing protein [Mycena capillaripes]